jgi:ATP-dependent protease ClpP protease subunit
VKKHTFNITAQRAGKTLRLVLSGYIYPGAERTSSASVCDALNEMEEGDELEVHIRNLYGGSVVEGLTIYHDLKALKPVMKIDGVAASMGAIIPLAGKRIEISRHSKMMLHRVSAGAYGDPDQMEEQVKQAREWETELVGIIAERTGMKEEEVRKTYMNTGKDIWLTAEQAKKAKLADEVVKGSLLRSVPEKDLEKAKEPEDILEAFAAVLSTEEEETENQPSNNFIMKFFGKKSSAIEALKGMKAEDFTPEQINAATAEITSNGINAFLVPITAEVKNATELQAMIDNLTNRASTAEGKVAKAEADAKAAKDAENAATTAKTAAETELAKVRGQRVLDTQRTTSDTGNGGDGLDKEPTAAQKALEQVNDPNAPWNKMADGMGFTMPEAAAPAPKTTEPAQ